jgi:hypothetical protein
MVSPDGLELSRLTAPTATVGSACQVPALEQAAADKTTKSPTQAKLFILPLHHKTVHAFCLKEMPFAVTGVH